MTYYSNKYSYGGYGRGKYGKSKHKDSYKKKYDYKDYEITAFAADDLLQDGDNDLNCGDTFTMPGSATVCIEVSDNDKSLSGDCRENATDKSGQKASIQGSDGEMGNGGQIYAEKYLWVCDTEGNWYVMIEIEQEGSDEDYYTFYTGQGYTVPPAGAELTVGSECNISGDWLKYDCLDAGEKEPEPGCIYGRLTLDDDCDNTEENTEGSGAWDEGLGGQTVQLLDLDGNVVAETTTDSNGNYSFTAAPGEYKVKFPSIEGHEFAEKGVGSWHANSDANADGTTDVITVSSGVDVSNIDASVKEVSDPDPDTICIEENTTAVVDLDCGIVEVPDQGTDLCQFKDKDQPADNKPVSLTLTYSFGTDIDQVVDQDSNKAYLDNLGTDNDGEVYIRILDKDCDVLFEGTVQEGESFTVEGSGKENKFDSETNFEVYDHEGGALLQSGQFHTSCSQPLAIGDAFGSVQLNGATLGGGTTFGLDSVDGGTTGGTDNGVTYSILGGADAALFEVDPDTGEVSFKSAPDFENPGDADGDNVYEVVVRATLDDGTVQDKPLEVCVEDGEEICIYEGTTLVVDLNSSVECVVEVPGGDDGVDLCQFKDKDQPADNKPVSLTLTYSFGTDIDQVVDQDSNKAYLDNLGTDNDGEVYIRILDKGFDVLFEGTVQDGESFTVEGSGKENKFDSETNFEVYDHEGGALLQSGQFHTSCSQPLAIGDVFGSVELSGATLGGGTTFTGSSTTTVVAEEGDLVYSIIGGEDASLFQVDPTTGVVSFKDAPDYENPLDQGMDNTYNVVVRATVADDPDCFVDETVVVEVKDVEEVGSLSGRYFCDTDDDNQDNGNGGEPGVAGVVVMLLDAAGNPTGATTTTDADGNYSFTGLVAGTYGVKFTDPDGVLDGKVMIDSNVGDDASDSDAIGDTTESTISNITVVTGQDTPDNDAGVEELGSLSGRYFCDTDDDNQDNGNGGEPGVAGVVVMLLDAAGNPTGATTTTDADGNYSFTGLVAGTYGVKFTDPDGVLDGKVMIDSNVGDDASDSDAIGDTTESTISNISVVPGQDTPDNDAGVEELGSLSGRYFCDTDDDNQDNGNGGEPGIAGVVVMLLDAAGNPTGATTTTDADGNYSFTGLVAGTYGVKFTDPDGVLDGKVMIDSNVGDDASDSDAIGDTTESTISNISVVPGEDTSDNDAGVEYPNTPPEVEDEAGATCADETLVLDLSDNGSDADGDTVTVVEIKDNDETVGVGGTITLDSGATVTLNADGTVTYDGIAAHSDLEIGQMVMENFGFTVSDGEDTAMGEVDVKVCGALNTMETIDMALKADGGTTVTFELDNFNPNTQLDTFIDAYTLDMLSSTSSDIGLGEYVQAYCIDSEQAISLGVLTTATVCVANEANALAVGVNNADKIDSVNWLLNNDQTLVDNGDGTGDTYTDLEVQEAIWVLLNNDTFFLNSPDFPFAELTDDENGVRDGVEIATIENAMEIAMLAMTLGDGFEAGAGDIVGLILDPTSPDEQDQPFLIGVNFDDLAQDCLC